MSDIKCNYIQCYAGMGVAGMKRCVLGGDYTNKNCENFRQDYDESLEHAEEEISKINEQNESLKCCGNCDHLSKWHEDLECHAIENVTEYVCYLNYCNKWKFDGMTRKERII